MGNKNKKPVVEAPTQEAPAAPATKVVDTNGKAFMPKKVASMSPDAKVTYFATLHDRYSKNVPDDLKDNTAFLSAMSAITDAVAVTIAIEEAVNNDTIFHAIVNKNDKPAYAALRMLCAEYGYTLPEANLLPAPTQEQLALAGKTDESVEDKGTVTIDPSKVSKEAKAKIAAEKKIVDSKPAESPVDVKDEAQLKASLTNIFVKGDRPVGRAKKAINFYRAYLKLQAKDKEDELKKIDEMSDITLLNDVKNIIGPCPYKDAGIAAFLRKLVSTSGNPVAAFCTLYRSARDKKTGELEATNELIAAICRTYVIWSCESVISEANGVIDSENRQLKKLDPKNAKHKEGIEAINKNIESKQNDIEWAKGVIDATVNPESEIIDNLIEAYNNDEDKNHNIAVTTVDAVLKTMYPNQDMTKYEADCVENNAKQYAGIICNLFRDPGAQMPDYSEGNILELVEAEKPAEEEKTQEEESKK